MSGSTSRWLALIILSSVILRLGVSVVFGDTVEAMPGIFDQISYHTLATRLLEGHGFTFEHPWWPLTRAGEPTSHWSFLYTFYLWVVYALVGIHPLAARLLQASLCGAVMPWLVYRLARNVFSIRDDSSRAKRSADGIALLAAGWVSLYGYFIYYSAALMTESFYIVSILCVLDAALRLEKKTKLWLWLELGAAIGTTVLLRQTFLLFVPFLFLWLFWIKLRETKPARMIPSVFKGMLTSTIVLVLFIAPFTILNYARFKRFVLLNTNAGYAFFWSNHPIQGYRFIPLFTANMPSYQELIPEELRQLDEAALDQALMERGMQFVKEDPIRFLVLSLSRIAVHFTFWPQTNSSLMSNFTRVFSLGIAIPFMVAGGWLWFKEMRQNQIYPSGGVLSILFILIYVGIHLLTWAGVRYRLPADAIGLVFAARGIYPLFQRLFFSKLNSAIA